MNLKHPISELNTVLINYKQRKNINVLVVYKNEVVYDCFVEYCTTVQQ